MPQDHVVRLRRAYERPTPADGCRVLVDRFWPRGLRRDEARIDEWLRDLAPSNRLRGWFGHRPERWVEFRRRYRRELDGRTDELDQLLALVDEGPVTLVFATADEQHNNAVVLHELVEERLPSSLGASIAKDN